MHLRIHSGVKPHHCDQCGYATIDSGSLRKHMRIHNDERPYKWVYILYDYIILFLNQTLVYVIYNQNSKHSVNCFVSFQNIGYVKHKWMKIERKIVVRSIVS
jgi:hypothetical protein